ncbi:hypothetical protein D5281_15090 [bacterium 1xD42-62]|uniref:Uncharacterized protein n=1 Tax=Parablautia muri TaxID=2320879 RepID=A0A9X5BH03_9FIRM|nr:hypothetical protein [Parablautia muri]
MPDGRHFITFTVRAVIYLYFRQVYRKHLPDFPRDVRPDDASLFSLCPGKTAGLRRKVFHPVYTGRGQSFL